MNGSAWDAVAVLAVQADESFFWISGGRSTSGLCLLVARELLRGYELLGRGIGVGVLGYEVSYFEGCHFAVLFAVEVVRISLLRVRIMRAYSGKMRRS